MTAASGRPDEGADDRRTEAGADAADAGVGGPHTADVESPDGDPVVAAPGTAMPAFAAGAGGRDGRGVFRGGTRARFLAGVRAGAPFALAGGLLATSFGVLARDAGMPGWAAVLMSAIVFAGSAQIAALTIVDAGGGLGSAIGAAALMNSRFLPMGVAIGPSLPGGPLVRAGQGQTVVDASWALASDGEGGFDRWVLFGSSAIQYVTWVSGTAAGVLFGSALGDPEKIGLDAIYPAFFLALLIGELRSSGLAQVVAGVGGLIALLLVPVAPPGIPVLAASLASLIGLFMRRRAEA